MALYPENMPPDGQGDGRRDSGEPQEYYQGAILFDVRVAPVTQTPPPGSAKALCHLVEERLRSLPGFVMRRVDANFSDPDRCTIFSREAIPELLRRGGYHKLAELYIADPDGVGKDIERAIPGMVT